MKDKKNNFVPTILVQLSLKKKKEVKVLFCSNAKIEIQDFDKILYLLQSRSRSKSMIRTTILPCKFK